MYSLQIFTLVYIFSCMKSEKGRPVLTLPKPTYYVNQTVPISWISNVSSLAIVSLTINKTVVLSDLECKLVAPGPVWTRTRHQGTSSDCSQLPTSGSVNLILNVRLSEQMRSSTVTCIMNYIDKGLVEISAVIVNAFDDVHVAPTTLEFDRFEFDDEVPVLNKKARVRCKSYGGFPASEFIYEVRNKSGVMVSSPIQQADRVAEFTINAQLKTGFIVTCRDKVHTREEISLTKQDCGGTGSEVCMPRYLTSNPPSQNVSLNPSYSNSLKCDVEGYPMDLITYSWQSSSEVVLPSTSATHTISVNISKAGTKEILTCTASLDKYGTETKMWDITWSLQATTSSAPATSSASMAIGVGVGVGLAVIIIAVVVGVLLYKKKRDNISLYLSTPSGAGRAPVNKHKKPTNKSTD